MFGLMYYFPGYDDNMRWVVFVLSVSREMANS